MFPEINMHFEVNPKVEPLQLQADSTRKKHDKGQHFYSTDEPDRF